MNLMEEHIEGRLCEKGLMKEHYDFEKNDLVRNLTPEGKSVAKNILKSPEWKKEYLKLAKRLFDRYPIKIRKILWKNIANQLKEIEKNQ